MRNKQLHEAEWLNISQASILLTFVVIQGCVAAALTCVKTVARLFIVYCECVCKCWSIVLQEEETQADASHFFHISGDPVDIFSLHEQKHIMHSSVIMSLQNTGP